jgi:hypothetical protein
MAVPVPRTRVAAAFETATLNNQDPRDVENFLLAPPRAYAYRSAAVTFNNGIEVLATLDAELYDPYSPAAHDNSTNNSRLIAAETGIYFIKAKLRYGGNSTGTRTLFIRKNAAGSPSGGTEVTRINVPAASASVTTTVDDALEHPLNAGEYIELFGVQDSGSNLVMNVGSSNLFLLFRWVAKQ